MAGVLLLLLLLLPFIELAVFIEVVGWVGLLPALGAIIAFGLVGTWLAQREGVGAWRRAQARLQAGEMPTNEVVNGILLFLAGVLLALPGFLSDILGLALLLPPVRALVRTLLFRRFERRIRTAFAGVAGGPQARIHTGEATYGAYDVHEVASDPAAAGGPERPPLGRA
jgi:UPF0716 protein FxsA